MNRFEKQSRFSELAKAYVSYQAARADLEVVETIERSDSNMRTDLDTFVEAFARAIDFDLKIKAALFLDHTRVIVRFHMFDNDVHSHCTFWKPGEAGQVDPNSCLRDPAPDELREWLMKEVSMGLGDLRHEAEQEDPLMSLSGVLWSENDDIADRHDAYLGQSLFEELRAGQDD